MTTITLTDPARATEAGAWAVKNIGYKHWTLNVPAEAVFTKHPRYEFVFNRKQDAMMFSLKWL
jgi:hypothetical protein